MATKYRIITDPFHPAYRYLQFEDREGTWRFVPDQYWYVADDAEEEKCHTELSNLKWLRMRRARYGCESELRAFVSSYPDIQTFFDEQNAVRPAFLKNKEEASKAPTVYLQ